MRERTNAGDNTYVNNKDFGMIAQSAKTSRGSNTPTQVGNDNQREGYNAYRGSTKNPRPPKVSKAQADVKPSKDWTTSEKMRDKQRAGGKGK